MCVLREVSFEGGMKGTSMGERMGRGIKCSIPAIREYADPG